MASQTAIDLVKANTLESKYPMFSDEEIAVMLDASKDSVSFTSYKIALLKSDSPSVSLGPLTIENNGKFWQGLAELYYRAYQQELNEASESNGGTIYMRRADETW